MAEKTINEIFEALWERFSLKNNNQTYHNAGILSFWAVWLEACELAGETPPEKVRKYLDRMQTHPLIDTRTKPDARYSFRDEIVQRLGPYAKRTHKGASDHQKSSARKQHIAYKEATGIWPEQEKYNRFREIRDHPEKYTPEEVGKAALYFERRKRGSREYYRRQHAEIKRRIMMARAAQATIDGHAPIKIDSLTGLPRIDQYSLLDDKTLDAENKQIVEDIIRDTFREEAAKVWRKCLEIEAQVQAEKKKRGEIAGRSGERLKKVQQFYDGLVADGYAEPFTPGTSEEK